ncbi:hypothetical protein DC522_21730 [Microvirga sp. KLBC 81]|uniref:hypothetical protein n=1 Tax=Microvirga sp. KLBC 81 TaxID=1862707 RepID=UPI000D512B20|nr:hypothetical protein [Microvirga sp. KLBC 81]PVE22305.1 hypothetical protein DC522_21730 [Microvirga sp. KLBC 81]
MTAIVQRLFNLAKVLETCAPLADEDARLLASVIRGVITGQPVEPVLGLAHGPGQRTLATQAALALRNDLLREAAIRFYPDLPPSAQARELARDLQRYAATGWLRERMHDACPVRHVGKQGELLWRILKARDNPLRPRAIRKILALK